jgi:hypothetical protein
MKKENYRFIFGRYKSLSAPKNYNKLEHLLIENSFISPEILPIYSLIV